MKAERIEELLGMLGCRSIKASGRGVRSSCPLAPWTHTGGKDKHPSFFVYIEEKDTSHCGCLAASCGFRGDLKQLVQKIEKRSGRKLTDLIWFVHEHDQSDLGGRLARAAANGGFYTLEESSEPRRGGAVWTGGKDYSNPLVISAANEALPREHEQYVTQMVGSHDMESISYLHGPTRRFTDETIRRWKLGWHPTQRRISVPQYDYLNRLVSISGRYVPYWPECVPLHEREKRVPKWMHSKGFDRELYLFGEDKFVLEEGGSGTVFLVEGAFDVIFLDQCGVPNVAAINGSYVNRIQIEKVVHWFDHVVILMDGDEAGVESAERLRNTFAKRIDTNVYTIADGRDPNDLDFEEVECIKQRFLY